MKVSLVLATVGRVDDVGRLVQSLIAQTSSAFELIVVDQNDDDRLRPHVQTARQAGLAVNHVRQRPPNLSAARNLGITQALGDIVAFPDDDCWYETDLIASIHAAFAAHPNWDGVVATWVEQSAGSGVDLQPEMLDSRKWRNYRGGDASSISLFIKMALFKDLGGFDSRLGVGQWFGAGEEIDLIFRALAADALLGRWPVARVHHQFWASHVDQPGITWRSILRRSRGTGALYIKHQLPTLVILRGIFSPLFKATFQWTGLKGLCFAIALSAGRMHGAIKWKIQEYLPK